MDAAKTGWAGVLLDDDGWVGGLFAVSIEDLIVAAGNAARVSVVAIDIPIGLPDSGRRAADVLARKAVGARWQCVFMTPTRGALFESSYPAALARNRELAAEGISKQAYALGPKIRQVDAWVPMSPVPVIEVHPEVCFARLAGHTSAHPKKTWSGTIERQRVLGLAGIYLPEDPGPLGAKAAVDDVLDAAAAAWTARRYAKNAAVSHPDPPECFSDGRACAIWS